jgi:transposase
LGREFTQDEALLYDSAHNFPLVTPHSMPYLTAKSDAELLTWFVGKRRAAERLRAVALKKAAGVTWDTHSVTEFCRRVGLTPIVEHNGQFIQI